MEIFWIVNIVSLPDFSAQLIIEGWAGDNVIELWHKKN